MRIRFSYIMLAFLSACDGCKTDDPQPKEKTELEKLPPATQEGKNTFGCLVNGKAWVTKSTVRADAVYQSGILSIGGSIIEPSAQSIGIALTESTEKVTIGNHSLLFNGKFNPIVRVYISDSCYYGIENYQDTFAGVLSITNFNQLNYIISCTFEFTTVTTGCDTLYVTDGRFDIKYIP